MKTPKKDLKTPESPGLQPLNLKKLFESSLSGFKSKINTQVSKVQNIKTPLDPIRESKIETKEMKAILIQSYVRRFLARKKFKKIKESIKKIQTMYRKSQCQNLFSNIRNAIICIQKAWRGYIFRKKQVKPPKVSKIYL